MPHYVLDYESRFRNEVMESFADAYARGETPVPCIACNRTVKFRDLLKTARELGAEALATGHYVRRVAGEAGPELHRGADPARDQSYFLFGTTREQLDFLRFPLGDLPKSETRALAERFDLAVADKPDSQDICFVPNGDYASVVQKLRPEAVEPGEIVDMAGRVVGRHEGIVRFTVGQRRGLALGGREGTDNDPLYVVRLEPATRRVVVGPRSALGRDEIALYDVNWIGPVTSGALDVQVRVRSSQTLRPATVELTEAGAIVRFADPEIGVSPGQACVVYDAATGSRVLGGGFIKRFA
jgi:tRNA-specific 2-thiouridylase